MISASFRRVLPLAASLGLVLAPAASAKFFDDRELSPRARGLGGSYAGLSGDATGIYYNPAGLVNVPGLDFRASLYQPWGVQFARVNQFAVAMPTEGWGTFALGYSDFRVEYEETVLSIERTLTVSHGFKVMEDLSSSLALGYSVNVYNLDYPTPSISELDLGSETTLGLDVGVLARLHDRTTAGAFFRNVNNPEMGDPVSSDLPQSVVGGLAYRPYDGVITLFEIEKQLDEDVQFHGGVEFNVVEPLDIRFGAQSKPNLLDFGVGLNYTSIQVDFSYTHHPVLDPTLHYGLGLKF